MTSDLTYKLTVWLYTVSCFYLYVQVREEFEKQWEAGTFPGWSKETSGALAHTGAYLDLSAFSSAEELASLGLDRLKSALMALNLKCGG